MAERSEVWVRLPPVRKDRSLTVERSEVKVSKSFSQWVNLGIFMEQLDFFKGYHWDNPETWKHIVENWDKPEFKNNMTTMEYVRQAKEKLAKQ